MLFSSFWLSVQLAVPVCCLRSCWLIQILFLIIFKYEASYFLFGSQLNESMVQSSELLLSSISFNQAHNTFDHFLSTSQYFLNRELPFHRLFTLKPIIFFITDFDSSNLAQCFACLISFVTCRCQMNHDKKSGKCPKTF